MQENGPGLHEVQCQGPEDAKAQLTGAAKAGRKVEEEDTTCRGRYESHGIVAEKTETKSSANTKPSKGMRHC